MAYGYMGRTTIDVVASLGAVMLLLALIVGIMSPRQLLFRVRDEHRVDGVRNVMEALLEMQKVQPDVVDSLREAYMDAGMPPRVMLGAGESCAGDWGAQCGDVILADRCLDGVELGMAAYLAALPIDPLEGTYTSSHTGYYVTFRPGLIEVGACAPESQEEIRLTHTFY